MLRDYALSPTSGIARKYIALPFVNVVGQTGSSIIKQQIASAFLGLGVGVYSEGAVTAIISVDAGHVPVGRAEKAVTLTVGADPLKFKLNSAVVGVSATPDSVTELPTVVHKAVTDNLPFSAADTINAAAVAVNQYWGAWRIRMDYLGAISTASVAADQNFATQADALANCPACPAPYIDLGTITVRSIAGTKFTAGVISLAAGGLTVSYNGKAAGFVSWLTGAITPVEDTIVEGVLAAQSVRQAPNGSLLVVHYTSDGAGAVVGATVQVIFRPFPLNGEVEL